MSANPTHRRPRRSALYMPGVNARALEKARTLAADVLIFDLEDAVAPDAKAQARTTIQAAMEAGGYGRREVVLRINGPDTEWWQADVALAASLPALSGVMLPKVETAGTVSRVADALADADKRGLTLWPMIETPNGIASVRDIACASPQVTCLVLGTQDLMKAMRIPPDRGRLGLLSALSECVLAARLAGLDILDGVHPDFRDAVALRSVCIQGRGLGFDGKTLIHPNQVDIANEVFGPDADEVETARNMVAAWDARPAGAGVIQWEGRMVEALHVDEARELVAFAEAITAG